jgi:A/G-specific adenine glycosylase
VAEAGPPRDGIATTAKGNTLEAANAGGIRLPASPLAGGVSVSTALRRQVNRRLRAWFQRHRRDLPWRHTTDPYAIWVSEVMLQQTQVATVVPFYLRFLEHFPTIQALAAAPEEQVLRHWEGLGYYRRARDLHRGARQLAAQHGGRLPDDPVVFGRIPGVGRYTLGAVLSQAFDRRLPIVEANSQRVLCRYFGWRDDPRSGPMQRQLWQTAEALLPRRQAGAFNQSLMELGALVCTPARPRCQDCPLQAGCQARRLGLQEQIPLRPAPPTIVAVNEVAVVLWRRGRVLLVQRPPEGRWASLWEFPRGSVDGDQTHEQAALRLLQQRANLEAMIGQELLTVRHGVTRFRITLVCLEARHASGRFRSAFYPQGRWLRPAELEQYPISTPQRRLARVVVARRQPRLF